MQSSQNSAMSYCTLVMRGWAKTQTPTVSRQPPAPIFLSDLDSRTRPAPDPHIQGLYAHEKPRKVMEF